MKKEKINSLLNAGVAFVLFVLIETLAITVTKAQSIQLLIVALLTVLSFSWLQIKDKQRPEKKNIEKLTWIYFIMFGLSLTFASQGLAYWILDTFEGLNNIDPYLSMSVPDMIVYVLISISIGAWSEELVFRWGMYNQLKKHFPILLAFGVSTIFFILIHGTLTHIPVTVAVSLLSCIIYELTGQFKFCVFTHCIFNLCSVLLDLVISKLPHLPVLFISLYIISAFGVIYLYFLKKTKKY